MIWLSVAIVITNPISAIMLAWIVLYHKAAWSLGPVVRGFLSLLCVALLLHAAGNAALIENFKPPRTPLWIPLWLSVTGVIWAAFLRTYPKRTRS